MWVLVYKPTIKQGSMYNSEREKPEHFFRFIFVIVELGGLFPSPIGFMFLSFLD